MIKYATLKLAFALTLVVLTAPAGRAFAQSTTPPPAPPTTTAPPPPTPGSVTGTDPEPQDAVVEAILVMFGLA